MSAYLVLARKYRPRTFEEVVGQSVVTRVLQGALQEGRLGHAYLFAGPRGTGKTTTARILAKCLNCESGPTATPCGTCERCLGADAGNEVDIIELDAASHTGVDTIRDLRDEAVYAPMRARNKVYIIDEVHMLSKGAFNALLKTLEEPPPHVVFLFATTEPHKVLDTILSRCQVLRLTALSEEEIVERLEQVFLAESIEAGEGVLQEIARGARGGMRDALSLADKLLALAGKKPALEDLERLGGEGGSREIDRLFERVEAEDAAGMLSVLGGLQGDETELLKGCLATLRTAVVLAHCGKDTPLVSASPTERERLVERAARLGDARLELWLQELLRARERMRLVPGQERLILESALLDLCRAETTLPLTELVERLQALEARLGAAGGGPAPAASTAAPAPATERAPAPEIDPAASEPTDRAAVKPVTPRAPARRPAVSGATGGPKTKGGALEGIWEPFLAELARTHGALAELLQARGAKAGMVAKGTKAVELDLGELAPAERKLVEDRRNRAACSRALSRVAGRSLELELKTPGDEAQAPDRKKSETRSAGKSASGRDSFTQEVADLFGGVVEDLS